MARRALAALTLLLVALLSGCLGADVLTIGSTTTTRDSGLLDLLVPAFEKDTGIAARTVVGGTGETIEKARRGDVDVLFTHSPGRERHLVEDGVASSRHPVMWSRFMIVGPDGDPAGVKAAADPADAFARIHASRATFVSRGDRSGTHDKELDVWRGLGLDPASFSSTWYKETGTGQGTTLMMAAEFSAYTLTDEGTFLMFAENGRADGLVRFFDDDPVLRNQYAVTLLEPERIPASIRSDEAAAFAAWITGPGQAVIATYTIRGVAVFTPDAGDPEA